MAKVFFVRHQSGGVMHEYPFAAPPTDKQFEAVLKLCDQRFGLTHPKTGDEYWTRIVDVELLDGETVPEIPEQGKDTANVAGLGPIAVTGRGTVTPREAQTIGAGDVADIATVIGLSPKESA